MGARITGPHIIVTRQNSVEHCRQAYSKKDSITRKIKEMPLDIIPLKMLNFVFQDPKGHYKDSDPDYGQKAFRVKSQISCNSGVAN